MTKYIHAIAVTPTGAQVSVHRLQKVELDTTRALITLNHYATDDQELPTWQDSYEMPIAAFVMGSYPDCIYDWLISPTGHFPSGQLMDDDNELETLRKIMLHETERLRDGHLYGGLTIPNVGGFDTDARAVQNIMGAVQMAVIAGMQNQPFTIDWRMIDNTTQTLDGPTMILVGATVASFVSAVYGRSWELKTLINSATNISDLEAVVLNGWPT